MKTSYEDPLGPLRPLRPLIPLRPPKTPSIPFKAPWELSNPLEFLGTPWDHIGPP